MSTIFKRTKILATIGPASNSPEQIEAMLLGGANGFRFNFSHATYEGVQVAIDNVRAASEKVGKPVAVLQDLQGPKIRLGTLTADVARAARWRGVGTRLRLESRK
jgi:pyruvate kinase